MLEAERIAKDPSVMGYSDMDELFADLRHYRIIQRVRIGAKICAAKRRKTAGILFVLQGFATHLWGKLAAKTCVGNCAVMPKVSKKLRCLGSASPYLSRSHCGARSVLPGYPP